jgi:ElaA protein
VNVFTSLQVQCRPQKEPVARGGSRVAGDRLAVVFTVREALTASLDAHTLYRILQLRVDVFVVEQSCPYRDLDGRDLDPDTRQFWAESDGNVAATLRVLGDSDGRVRIGRVATGEPFRGRGLAAALMAAALAGTEPSDVVLNAQTYLSGWYERFGFRPAGPEFVEDGIPHVPMLLRRG